MELYRVVYVSRVARQVRFADAEAIAASAAEKNAARGLTGMLVYSPSHFIQVLEGDRTVVDDVLSRIRKDPRHSHLAVVDARSVPAREFGEWAMVARRLHRSEDFDGESISAEVALELLRSLAGENRGP